MMHKWEEGKVAVKMIFQSEEGKVTAKMMH